MEIPTCSTLGSDTEILLNKATAQFGLEIPSAYINPQVICRTDEDNPDNIIAIGVYDETTGSDTQHAGATYKTKSHRSDKAARQAEAAVAEEIHEKTGTNILPIWEFPYAQSPLNKLRTLEALTSNAQLAAEYQQAQQANRLLLPSEILPKGASLYCLNRDGLERILQDGQEIPTTEQHPLMAAIGRSLQQEWGSRRDRHGNEGWSEGYYSTKEDCPLYVPPQLRTNPSPKFSNEAARGETVFVEREGQYIETETGNETGTQQFEVNDQGQLMCPACKGENAHALVPAWDGNALWYLRLQAEGCYDDPDAFGLACVLDKDQKVAAWLIWQIKTQEWAEQNGLSQIVGDSRNPKAPAVVYIDTVQFPERPLEARKYMPVVAWGSFLLDRLAQFGLPVIYKVSRTARHVTDFAENYGFRDSGVTHPHHPDVAFHLLQAEHSDFVQKLVDLGKLLTPIFTSESW